MTPRFAKACSLLGLAQLLLVCQAADATAQVRELGPSIPLAAPAAPGGPPTAPFGPGAVLQVTSDGDPVTVYVAKTRAGDDSPLADSAFVKIGKTPIELQLPPGSYRIEAEGHGISNESLAFEMRGEPRRLLVNPGSEGLGVVGTLFLGIGITAVVAGTAILASGTQAPAKLDKAAVLIPLYASGVVIGGLGVGFLVAADTDIEEPEQPLVPPDPRQALGLGATFHF
jgi:hypothetical protein